MCFLQRGGAPVHFSTIKGDGVVGWPSWSSDLNPLDFFCVAYGGLHHSDKPEARCKLLEAMNEAIIDIGNEVGSH
jgi:hypothetical protein